MDLEAVATALVDSGLKVHRTLGPGLLESIYEECLIRELQIRGIETQRQVSVPIIYEGRALTTNYRLDMVVANAIIVEIKAVETLTNLHEAQLLTYLKLSNFKIGFLINFNVKLFKNGIRRLIRAS